MKESRLRHLSHTYNLVYNLSFSESVVNEAISKSYNFNLNEINIDSYITNLQELYLKTVKNK